MQSTHFKSSPLFISCLALLAGLVGTAHASPAYDAAFTLLTQHHFAEADAALRVVIKNEPTNAAAYHALSRAIMAGMPVENPSKEEAESRVKDVAQCLARASELEPTNAAYLRDFGMSQITGVTSIRKGRKILEQALELNPKDAETHNFLAIIYSAPWALGGDKEKAAEHRKTFQELDPTRFALDEINRLLWIDKKFPAAFSFCEELLKKEPESAVNHFLYGNVAATAKTNLEQGLASLKKALTLPCPVPTGNSPYSQPYGATPSNFWEKIGEIEDQLGHPEESRAAFAKAVELDPTNYWAAKGLARFKS